MPKVNYADADKGGFEPLPDGLYDAVLSEWELKEGQKGPYYAITFTLPNESNRKVWMNLSISSNGLWRFKRDMIRLGAEPSDLAPGSDVDTDDVVAGVVGAECRLKLKTVEYTGNDGEQKQRNEVTELLGQALSLA